MQCVDILNDESMPPLLDKKGSGVVSNESMVSYEYYDFRKTHLSRWTMHYYNSRKMLVYPGSETYLAPRISSDFYALLQVTRSEAVIRCFLGNLDVVRMTFTETRSTDSDELRFCLKLFDIPGATVSHPLDESTDQLMNGI